MRLEIGFLEFAIAAGFLIRKFRRFTGWVAALTLLLFFPANIYAALNHIPMGGHEWGPDDLESVNPWRPRGIKIHGSTDFTTRQGHGGGNVYQDRAEGKVELGNRGAGDQRRKAKRQSSRLSHRGTAYKKECSADLKNQRRCPESTCSFVVLME